WGDFGLLFLYCLFFYRFALGGGLGRPRRLGIPSPEGERRMTNAHLKVLHFDLESSLYVGSTQANIAEVPNQAAPECVTLHILIL
ncbi:hypothetical protein, partial [Muribaculum intestinale]|uniref:hypothetical protein n=1 Tax=Muribaculum intestinale TaxID=1796646 RepID=UPI0025A5C746